MTNKIANLIDIFEQYRSILDIKILPDSDTISKQSFNIYDEYIIEVRSGVGGDESDLFCEEIFELYRKALLEFTSSKNIIVDDDDKTIYIKDSALGFLIYETGTYRVQRVPKTEKAGRLHTSTISVSVIGVDNTAKIKSIPDKELKVEVSKSSGPGGQHVQKSSTAVDLTHIPTGIKASCQSQRSQIQNRESAMQILIMRLNRHFESKAAQNMASQRNRSADRSAKVATMNYKRNEIVDHRTGYSRSLDLFTSEPHRIILERAIIFLCSDLK